ncbi:MAG: DUF3574 domain-containing protein [Rhodoplanes sp.]|uniref:DUF3574 domain-containing protein n=1 Tax=Rhodoplanes sp. TaxID=1968906 RepID=UPI0017907393|nr:DUF3574 domain-containing protein [Rhodoplanes sp.]NVO16007.1 DUF3574 domain-containing protein [Rhodoplanes sp.]
MLFHGPLLVAGVAAFGAAPGVAQEIVCPAGETRSVVTELFFGRDGGGRRVVTAARWEAFLAHEITPRFPNGLTVIDARGQWRDPAGGRITREATKLVVLVTPADAASGTASRQDRVAAIVDTYKRRFRQKSVLVLTRPACARF